MGDRRSVEDSGAGGSLTAVTMTLPNGFQAASTSHNAALEIGSVLADRYEILALLGEGGMGAVYEARDLKLERNVALKVIRGDLATNSDAMQRFKQELILAREVTHANVVRIYDLGEADGINFITMEFIEGENLASILSGHGKLAPDEAVDIIHQVCRGLEAAHAQGIIHRDLKPGNIMRDAHGRIVLMDFGLARTAESHGLTQTGALIGTMEYMSPEQARTTRIDARSDLFAVGLIFYELLTGVRPYQADTAIASLIKRTREHVQPPTTFDNSIPVALSDICTKALEVDPNDRYQSASELLHDLDAWKTTSRLGGIKHALTRARRAIAHAQVPWWTTAALAMVLAVALAGVFFLRQPKAPVAHRPIAVLVADFTNHTGDPVFDRSLEPMFNVALEGATFINAFNRGTARKLASKLPNPTDKLDEQPARLVAVSKGVSVVITGEVGRRGEKYSISATALDSVTGNVVAKAEVTAANKEEVLATVPKLVAPIRKALGDSTPESAQLESAGGAFTAASLEVVHQYSLAMEQQFAGKSEEAMRSFRKAAELDAGFARAYSGMAGIAMKQEQLQDADRYIKLAMEHVDRMTDRERFRVRGLYYLTVGNWHKCSEEYDELVKRYPGDNIGHNNLAVCLSQARNLVRAVEEARTDVANNPNAAAAANLSLFSTYSGDFQNGERGARQLLQTYPSFQFGYLALAFSQLGQGQLREASESYGATKKLSPLGASFGASGLADLALYEGRFAEAARLFEQGAAADLADKNPDAAAEKFVALAYTHLSWGKKRQAIEAADKALANSHAVKIRFMGAMIYVDAGQPSKAQPITAALAAELYDEPQAYAKIVSAKAALARGEARQAVSELIQANKLLDTWIGHFELGRAYLQAGALAEADSELDRCIRRRGETLALFLDLVPTYGYLPPVYYYQGRVREEMKSAGFADFYRTYLSIRGQANEDPLLPEIRRRAARAAK